MEPMVEKIGPKRFLIQVSAFWIVVPMAENIPPTKFFVAVSASRTRDPTQSKAAPTLFFVQVRKFWIVVPMAENIPHTNEPIVDSVSCIFVPIAEKTFPTQDVTVVHRPINHVAKADHTLPNQAVICPQCWIIRMMPVMAAAMAITIQVMGLASSATVKPQAATVAATRAATSNGPITSAAV